MNDRRLLRRFYEPLLLLDALGPVRGDQIKSEIRLNEVDGDTQKLRRAFADG